MRFLNALLGINSPSQGPCFIWESGKQPIWDSWEPGNIGNESILDSWEHGNIGNQRKST